ncbi:MAG: NAD-dependent epimerase/dehydratase family protein [Candidatus Peribacteraceae bacterium]|nr:NAD-dependent epimerase/dehydratase family protein [Candidatus Peribacteraceae bacterium]
MSTKHLVTGGLGFIGSALVRRLVRDGHAVRSFDNSSRGSAERLGACAKDVEIVEGDIRDPVAVRRAMKDIGCVWHLAFVNGTEFFYRYPAYVLDVGVKGMTNVLNGAIQEGVPELILASSSEVYQTPPSVPTDEETPLSVPDPLNPRYSYGGGKIISELMALNYGREHFDRVLVFRPHNVYGPAMGYEHVIPQFICRLQSMAAASDRMDFPIQGDGLQTRAFIFIDDFVDGLLLMYGKGSHMNIYNIGTMDEVAIASLVTTVAACMGRNIRIVQGAAMEGGTLRRCPDTRKLKALGFCPKTTLEAGLRPTIEWYVSHPRPTRSGTIRADLFLS